MSVKVKEFYKDITKKATIVGENEPLDKVVRAVLEDPKTRNAYVVDSDGKLMGVIVSKDLLDFVGKRSKFVLGLFATQAKDLMRPAVSASLDTDAEEALRLCVENGLEEIPVCKNGKVVGEVIFFEIIKALGEKSERRA